MKILEKNFKVEPVPQGNRTVRFRWELEQGEQISKVAVPFIYVTKDHWRTAMGHATTARLEISPLPEDPGHVSAPNKYAGIGGKATITFLHFDIWQLTDEEVDQRKLNTLHPIPLVYINANWWNENGSAAPFAIIELIPVLPE